MKFEEIKQNSVMKVVLRAQSGRGKTYSSCVVAMEVSKLGGDVLYIDTEAEGSTTIVQLVESGEYEEEDVEGIEYRQADSYDSLMRLISDEKQQDYDLVVVDTLDHKHSYAINQVVDDPKHESPDWNMYPNIYSLEKNIMETLGKAKTNIIATIDPESGSADKPKGCQTNVIGYFSIAIDIKQGGEGRVYQVRNWVGKDNWIGKSQPKLKEVLVKEIQERMANGQS